MFCDTEARRRSARAAKCGGWKLGLLTVASLAAIALPAGDALAAQPPVGLGTAGAFAVLAGSTVTNTGPSTINGDLGLSPGTAVTGFPPGTVNGVMQVKDAVAGQAQADLTTAYNDAAGRVPPVAVPSDLGGLTLTSGVYKAGSSLGLTGTLTLNGQGNPNSVFIFKAPSTLITATSSVVKMINGAQPCNVYWQVGSSATLGASSTFVGNILAYTSISMDNAVTVHGRSLARNGAVTLINDTITAAPCKSGTSGGTGGTGGTGGAGGGTAGGGSKGTGTAVFTTKPRSVSGKVARYGTSRCVHGTFRVAVTGLYIRRVVFSLGKQILATRMNSPFTTMVKSAGGIRTVTARVTFTHHMAASKLHWRYRACAAAKSPTPAPGPRFTG